MKTSVRVGLSVLGLAALGAVIVSLWELRPANGWLLAHVEIVNQSSHSSIVFEKIEQDLMQKFEGLRDQPIWRVSLTELSETLNLDSRLESYHIRRQLPNSIQVTIVPKQPLAGLLLQTSGRVLPIAADGSLLEEVNLIDAVDWPLVRGDQIVTHPDLKKTLVEVLSAIPTEGEFSRQQISEVFIEKSGEVSVLLSDDGTKVLIGNQLSEVTVQRVNQVLKYLKSRSIKGRVIDARFSKKVVVRVRKAS